MFDYIVLLLNFITLITSIFLVGRAEHTNDEISARIDELSMIESKLVNILDEYE